jgi:hypothetical protein
LSGPGRKALNTLIPGSGDAGAEAFAAAKGVLQGKPLRQVLADLDVARALQLIGVDAGSIKGLDEAGLKGLAFLKQAKQGLAAGAPVTQVQELLDAASHGLALPKLDAAKLWRDSEPERAAHRALETRAHELENLSDAARRAKADARAKQHELALQALPDLTQEQQVKLAMMPEAMRAQVIRERSTLRAKLLEDRRLLLAALGHLKLNHAAQAVPALKAFQTRRDLEDRSGQWSSETRAEARDLLDLQNADLPPISGRQQHRELAQQAVGVVRGLTQVNGGMMPSASVRALRSLQAVADLPVTGVWNQATREAVATLAGESAASLPPVANATNQPSSLGLARANAAELQGVTLDPTKLYLVVRK